MAGEALEAADPNSNTMIVEALKPNDAKPLTLPKA
jgi:hypothetical protein